MAKFRITGPDGSAYEITAPDDAKEDDVMSYAQQQFASKGAAPAQPKEDLQAKADAWSKRNTDFVTAAKNIPRGVMQGVRDVTGGLTQLAAHGAGAAFPSLKGSVAEYDQVLKDRESEYQAATEGTPFAAGTGRIAGNVLATLPVSAIKAFQGGGLGAAMGNTALQGAAIGGSQPVLEGDFATEKGKQTALGAAVSPLVTAGMRGAARVVRPNTSTEVQMLLDAGVTPTPGQMLGGRFGTSEEKLTSIPLLGDAITSSRKRAVEDLNRAVYDRALKPIGEKTTALGRDAVSDVSSKLGKAYEELLPKLTFNADKQFSADLSKITAMARSLPEPQAKQFEKVLQEKLIGKMTPQGNMSGESLKAVETELTRIAKGYRGDASFDNRQLGDALEEVLSSVRSNLQRSNPQHAERLADINKGYANYARIRDAAGRVGTKEGIFSPAQLQSAVRAGDKSVGKGNFAKGNALMQDLSDAGVNVLGPTYPDSGTAGRVAMGGIFGGAAAGAGAINPAIPLTMGAAALPYLPGGRQLAAALLAKRPELAKPIAKAFKDAAPAIGWATAPTFGRAFLNDGD